MSLRLSIGILFGGDSPEHEVSIVTARAIAEHLDPARFERFLEHFVGEWLAALEVGLRRADCPPDRVADTATLILAQIRGLLLDLLATGDRDRVDRSFLLFVDTIDIYARSWRSAAGKAV